MPFSPGASPRRGDRAQPRASRIFCRVSVVLDTWIFGILAYDYCKRTMRIFTFRYSATRYLLLFGVVAVVNCCCTTQGRSKMFFDNARRMIQLRPSRQWGGLPDTVPSPKHLTNFYVKLNTADGRESPPPMLYKTEHRGR